LLKYLFVAYDTFVDNWIYDCYLPMFFKQN
jgi:hypothetical protein